MLLFYHNTKNAKRSNPKKGANMAEARSTELLPRENPFDVEGAIGVPLSATNYLLDKFRSDAEPGVGEPEVYINSGYGNELLPPGMLVYEQEFDNDPDGSRIPDGSGSFLKHPVITGYIDGNRHLRLFGTADRNPEGGLQVPQLVQDRMNAIWGVDASDDTTEGPRPYEATRVITSDELESILDAQYEEYLAAEQARVERMEARAQGAEGWIRAKAGEIGERRQAKEQNEARRYAETQAAGIAVLASLGSVDQDGTMTAVMPRIGDVQHGRHGAPHTQHRSDSTQPHTRHPGRHSSHYRPGEKH
jgi:hypothetical protein